MTEAKEEIVEGMISKVFRNESAKIALAVAFLCESDKDYLILYKLRNNEAAFKGHVEKLLASSISSSVPKAAMGTEEETRQAIEVYKKRFMVPLPREKRLKQRLEELALYRGPTLLQTACLNAADTATQAFVAAQFEMLIGGFTFNADKVVSAIVASKNAVVAADNALYAAKCATGLQICMLGYHFATNIKKYWQGEIDLEECIKECVSKTMFCAGAAAGAFVFGAVNPVAGVAGSFIAGLAAEKFWRELFDVSLGDDKYRRLQKAYDHLGVSREAPDADVRKAYHTLAMKHHPDKGGEEAQFVKVNFCYELIRQARQTPGSL